MSLQAFSQTLDQLLERTRQLEQLLLEESTSLDGRDPDRLQALVERKQRVVGQVEQKTAALRQIIDAAGEAFTPEGVANFLQAQQDVADDEASASARWKRLRALAASCELLNRDNAQAVERSRKRVATALKIIRGDIDDANTYSARGYAQSGSVVGRTLTQA
jgi:flagella synthesis protein FlgN